MARTLRLAVFALCFGVCAFAALRASPFMTEVSWIPAWLGWWLDGHGNTRHLVGYGALALVGSWALCLGRTLRGWLVLLGGLFAMALLLEVAQMLLPNRHADWRDVTWSWGGVIIGTALAQVIWAGRGRKG